MHVTNKSSCAVSNAAVIGGAVGGAVGGTMVVLFLIYWFYWRARTPQQPKYVFYACIRDLRLSLRMSSYASVVISS